MPLTDRLDDVAQAVFNILTTNKTTLGLADVWWGDQALLPRTPAACVEPLRKTRELNGAPRRTEVMLFVQVLLFVGRIQDVQVNRKEVDAMSESVEAALHADATLGGIVIHSLVDSIDSGYATRSNTLYRASRVNLTAKSQAQLPYTP